MMIVTSILIIIMILKLSFSYGNGINRTAIELPEDFSPDDLQYLSITTSGNSGYSVILDQIIDLFYLSNDYQLIHLDIEDINESIVLDENNLLIQFNYK